MKNLILILGLLISMSTFGQNKINQLNPSGKKEGKWTIYLDNAWNETKDSTKASFSKYTYFDNGVNLFPMGSRDKNWLLKNSSGVSVMKGHTILLDGEYSWVDSNGKTRAIDIFKNGEYILHKFFYTNGEINQIFDYSKKYKGQDYTWTISEYDKKGNLKFFIHRKGAQGWMLYQGSEDDLK